MTNSAFELIGFCGLALFLWSYGMVSLGYWRPDQLRTHVPNLLGALLMLVTLIPFWNLSIFILEICWGAIALIGIRRSMRRN